MTNIKKIADQIVTSSIFGHDDNEEQAVRAAEHAMKDISKKFKIDMKVLVERLLYKVK
jgi:hypothetical protein